MQKNEALAGTVIFADEVHAKDFKFVQDAARAADLPVDKLHTVKPRNAFIRAVRALQTQGVVTKPGASDSILHKFTDDEENIKFQFSAAFLQEQGVNYECSAVVTFNKESHVIDCADLVVKQIAADLYAQVMDRFSTADIQAYVKKIIEEGGAKRIPLRDGVYFIAAAYVDLAEKIKTFYTQLGVTFYVLPVGASGDQKQSVLKAIVSDIKRTIKSLCDEVTRLKSEDSLTKKIAVNRIKELRKDLKGYRELATSLQADIGDLIHEAGDAGEILCTVGSDNLELLISSVQKSGRIGELAYDLISLAEPEIAATLPKPLAAHVDIQEESHDPQAEEGESQAAPSGRVAARVGI